MRIIATQSLFACPEKHCGVIASRFSNKVMSLFKSRSLRGTKTRIASSFYNKLDESWPFFILFTLRHETDFDYFGANLKMPTASLTSLSNRHFHQLPICKIARQETISN